MEQEQKALKPSGEEIKTTDKNSILVIISPYIGFLSLLGTIWFIKYGTDFYMSFMIILTGVLLLSLFGLISNSIIIASKKYTNRIVSIFALISSILSLIFSLGY